MLGALDEAAYIANPEKSDSMTHQSQGQYWAEPERLRDRRLKVRYRRISPIPVRPGEGQLTEPTAATQPWRRELGFMPHCCHCLEPVARSQGKPTLCRHPTAEHDLDRPLPILSRISWTNG